MTSDEVDMFEVHPITESSVEEDCVDMSKEDNHDSIGSCSHHNDDKAARPNKRRRSVQFKLFGADIVGDTGVNDEAASCILLDLLRKYEDGYECSRRQNGRKRFKHLKLFGADIVCEAEDGDEKPPSKPAIRTEEESKENPNSVFATQSPPLPSLVEDHLSNAIPTSSWASTGNSNVGQDSNLDLNDAFLGYIPTLEW